MLPSEASTGTSDEAVLDHANRFPRLDDLCQTTVATGAFTTSLIVSTATTGGHRAPSSSPIPTTNPYGPDGMDHDGWGR
jgi:hypothetical protein